MTRADLTEAERYDLDERIAICMESGISEQAAEDTAWRQVLDARVAKMRAARAARAAQPVQNGTIGV